MLTTFHHQNQQQRPHHHHHRQQEQLSADRLRAPEPPPPPLPSAQHHHHQQLMTAAAAADDGLDSVIIRNLIYEVGRGRAKKRILNRINLTVPEGSIYGLLGPSGCGKTTMLRCVVGRIRARAGSVLVFGQRPGEGRGEVPGRDVGYMPQEISIYEDFTIEETLRYFGKINRLDGEEIKRRIEFLLQFLDLPSKGRLVANLSGGQKRRVSLAAALVHSPPLLILDEPTVGVDPLLRQTIWEHLVSLAQTERISVIITTHYIEEARQAHVVGLMRHGKLLAEASPAELMRRHQLANLEDVFLRLCMSDSSSNSAAATTSEESGSQQAATTTNKGSYAHRWESLAGGKSEQVRLEANLFTRPTKSGSGRQPSAKSPLRLKGAPIVIHTGTNEIELNQVPGQTGAKGGFVNEAADESSLSIEEDDDEWTASSEAPAAEKPEGEEDKRPPTNYRQLLEAAASSGRQEVAPQASEIAGAASEPVDVEDYLALQSIRWAARRSQELQEFTMSLKLRLKRGHGTSKRTMAMATPAAVDRSAGWRQWWRTLMAVTWKNYVRLRRNPPVLVFQFMLPAIQVILFCLCIGGEPFDVPVAIVNDELVPRASQQFLDGLNRKIIRQVRYDNLSSAMEAVRRGNVWGALHIPAGYSQNLQTRLVLGEEATNETISNGTIRVYPDLTNLHLALALEGSFRETFIKFARDSLDEMGYDRQLADLPIQVGQPIYGTTRKDSYLEFMAPGVVVSISYVMATGLTALAFILERRDGLLERSLVSGVHTTQILLAHAINQVVVMVIQIVLVMACTFFVFEIPSRGPFAWVVLLILLQGCTGMGFGLLVSALCKEENTAVMMVVGTFYTNLILAGIIWPIEAMPHWLRPLSYAQPQTLATESLRHILSRGWGIAEPQVLLGFGVTLGWLVVFLATAGLIFKYSR